MSIATVATIRNYGRANISQCAVCSLMAMSHNVARNLNHHGSTDVDCYVERLYNYSISYNTVDPAERHKTFLKVVAGSSQGYQQHEIID